MINSFDVSILVLVDVALERRYVRMVIVLLDVSILVLVDVALEPNPNYNEQNA